MIMMLDSVKMYIRRYAKLAEEMAAKEEDPKRKQELETMSANCYQIAGGVPQTFWQAIQLFNLATTLIQIEEMDIQFHTDVWISGYIHSMRKI